MTVKEYFEIIDRIDALEKDLAVIKNFISNQVNINEQIKEEIDVLQKHRHEIQKKGGEVSGNAS